MVRLLQAIKGWGGERVLGHGMASDESMGSERQVLSIGLLYSAESRMASDWSSCNALYAYIVFVPAECCFRCLPGFVRKHSGLRRC